MTAEWAYVLGVAMGAAGTILALMVLTRVVEGMNDALVGHMADNEVKSGQQMLQYAIEALQHAVNWNGIAHLGAEKAKALLDELSRLRSRAVELEKWCDQNGI